MPPVTPLPLAPELMARWGIGHDGVSGALRLAPRIEPGESRAACPAFRAGRTVVGLELRRRPGGVTLRIAVRFGPSLRVEVEVPGGGPGTEVLVDGVLLVGPLVAFEARAEHEVAWLG